MRDQGIEAFEYLSARSSDALVQVAVLSPAVFQSTPCDQVEITAEITAEFTAEITAEFSADLSADYAAFLCHDDGTLHHFLRDPFPIGGQLPGAAH
jgi:hypothetical protein